MPPLRLVRLVLLLAVVLAAGVVAAARVTAADGLTLTATVGPDFSISLTMPDGSPVQHLDAGSYTIVVHDRSPEHNFHLMGPGVDTSTTVPESGDTTWSLTLRDGTYTFQCDPHATAMRGSFTVGTATTTGTTTTATTTTVTTTTATTTTTQRPAPKRPATGGIAGTVGPGFTIGVKTGSGAAFARHVAGRATIVIRDRSRIHNFHLIGPGVNKSTGVGFVGSQTWRVTLRRGTYRFQCDPHASGMKGSFRVG